MQKDTHDNTTPEAQRRNIAAELSAAGVVTHVTPSQLRESHLQIMAEVRSIRQDMNDGRDGRMLARVTAMPFGANTDAIEFQHSDGGKYKVPDDFVFPSVDILCGWKYWWTGFSSKALPKKKRPLTPWQVEPLRNINPADIPRSNKILKNSRKMCSGWIRVFSYIEKKLDEMALIPVNNLKVEWKEEPYTWVVNRHVSKILDKVVAEYKALVLTETNAGKNKVMTFYRMLVKVQKGSTN